MKDLYRQIYLDHRRTLEVITMDPEEYIERDDREGDWDLYCDKIYSEYSEKLRN